MPLGRAQQQSTQQLVTALLRQLVLGDVDSACAIAVSDRFDADQVAALLERNQLSGYLYTLGRDTELMSLLPAPFVKLVTTRYRDQAERNQKNVALLTEVQQALADASIPWLSLKGLYLAQRFFGGVDRRFMWDLDILVRPEDFQPAMTAVAAVGLHPSSPSGLDTTNRFWGIHAVQLRASNGYLDMHHSIRCLPKVSFNHDAFWQNAIRFQVGDHEFPALCDTDTLLTSAVGLGADLQSSHHGLRKIWDLYIMLRELDASVDWQAFFSACDRQGCLKLVLNVFAFSLLLIQAVPDCPRLQHAMSTNKRDLVRISTQEQAAAIFARKRQHLANRWLYSRLLPVSPLRYWLGWATTLPVRAWQHRHG